MILALTLATAKVAPEAGATVAEMAKVADTAAGLVQAGQRVGQIAIVTTVSVDAEVALAVENASLGAQ